VTLREQRCTFARLLVELLIWIEEQGWQVALDEGKIFQKRKVTDDDGIRYTMFDSMHASRSYHYSGLAQDLLLYDDLDGDGDDDDYVRDGSDPRWFAISQRWESMHPLCVSGIRWRDANHVSFGEGSKNVPLSAFRKEE
jgi:hypothetical protein